MQGAQTRQGVHAKRCAAATPYATPCIGLHAAVCTYTFAESSCRAYLGLLLCSSTEANKYSQEELRLMKTQDMRYVSLKAQAETKARLASHVYVRCTNAAR